jgi:hypothetical protein
LTKIYSTLAASSGLQEEEEEEEEEGEERRDRIALAGDASRNHGVVRGELSEVSFHKVRKVVELPRVESNGVEAAMSEKSLGLLTPSYATLLLVLFQ